MITGFHLSNFKAIGDSQFLPVRPITLIYGPNSGGKSSLLHGLLWAHHALTTGTLDVRHPKAAGQSVDLGGFTQSVHGQKAGRGMSVGLEFPGDHLPLPSALVEPGAKATTTWRFACPVTSEEDTGPYEVLEHYGPPDLSGLDLALEGDRLLSFVREDDGPLELAAPDPQAKLVHAALLGPVRSAHRGSKAKRPSKRHLSDGLVGLSGEPRFAPGTFLPNGMTSTCSKLYEFFNLHRTLFGDDQDPFALEAALEKRVSELIGAAGRTAREILEKVVYLGPARAIPPRELLSPSSEADADPGAGMAAWLRLRTDERAREAVNNWLRSPAYMQTPFEFRVTRLVDPESREVREFLLTRLAGIVERAWDLGREHPDEDSMMDALMAANMDAGPETDLDLVCFSALPFIDDLMAGSEREAELPAQEKCLHLWDLSRDLKVSHRDVGVGISQVLPFLVQALAAEKQLTLVEQPELHLHPALQAELGDVLIESALGSRANTFVLETHSEHLLLRLMRRIRETTNGCLPSGLPPTRPEDVSVVYVEQVGSASVVRGMPLNEQGELVKPWPGGFFEEGLREVLA